MKLIIIRHGQSIANEKEHHQGKNDGWQDTQLSKKGIEQAKSVATRLNGKKIEAIYSSDLKRAKQTADIIGKELNIKIKLDKRLREKTDEDGMEDFIYRVQTFFTDSKLLNKCNLVVAHEGVNLTLLAISTGNKKKGGQIVRRYQQSNTCVNIIEKDGKHYKIKLINDISHLKPDKNLIKIFEKVQKIPYQVCQFNEKKINLKLKSGDCRHKSELLKNLLEEDGYKVKKIKVIFDWKDLPIPKKILNILKESSTIWSHDVVSVKVHGNYLCLDPSWNLELEKKGFPVTREWSGLKDTKQVTEGELEFIKERDYMEDKEKIMDKFKIKIVRKEAHAFAEGLNKWLSKDLLKKSKK